MKSDFCKDNCQSNCEQPSSGGSFGDVQSRVVGYYEAWKHDQACAGMDFDQIPVDAFTHINFAFGYISPESFDVVPMDNLDPELFTSFTKIKERNRDVKLMVALGGWTFNDNDTSTQPVFHDIVSSPENRKKFIENLISFMNFAAFDGVDFDWVSFMEDSRSLDGVQR
jgi:chitinase